MKTNWSRYAQRFGRAFALVIGFLISSCGGGGGGGGGATQINNSAETGPAPYVLAVFLSFPDGVPPSLAPEGFGSSAVVLVLDRAGGSPISNATVSVNGVAMRYNQASSRYESSLIIPPGAAITLRTQVNGATYSHAATQPLVAPQLKFPSPASTWSTLVPNSISWNANTSNINASQVFAVYDTRGNQVWPTDGSFHAEPPASSTFSIAAHTLTVGDRLAMVGTFSPIGMPDLAPSSGIVLGAFSFVQFNVSDTPPPPPPPPALASITITPEFPVLLNGDSLQMVATGTYTDGNTQDLTNHVKWKSADAHRMTVSSGGLVTWVNKGHVTVTAELTGVQGTRAVSLFQPTPSPTPLVSQSVARGINPAHTGNAIFGSSLNRPLAPAWSVSTPTGFSPLVADGKVFLVTGGPSYSLYAFDLTTGTMPWGPVPIGSDGGNPLRQAYDNGKLFVIRNDGLLSAFGATNGNALWTLQIGIPTSVSAVSQPTAINGIVFVTVNGKIYAVDAASGKVLWSALVISYNSPTIEGNSVYVIDKCAGTKFDAVKGTVIWQFRSGCSASEALIPIANGTLFLPEYFGGERRNSATGSLVGTLTPSLGLVLSGSIGVLRNSSYSGLRTENLNSGEVLWSLTGDWLPLIIDQTVIAVNLNSDISAFDITTGNLLWSITAPAGSDDFSGREITAGEGYLIVPSHQRLTAWRLIP